MRLISLNVWGGSLFGPLEAFLKEQGPWTDIFCFQEVFNKIDPNAPDTVGMARLNLLDRLSGILSDHSAVFLPTSQGHSLTGPVGYPTEMGLAIFVKKNFRVIRRDKFVVFGNFEDRVKEDFSNIPRSLLQVEAAFKRQSINIFNYHGLPKPGDKLDTPDRLEQSQKIVDAMGKSAGPKILCGDFNLMPETESIKIIERAGYGNLIARYNISSTRNKISWQQFNQIQNFADYVFVSPEVKVKFFEVPYNEISDHLPIILDFEIRG